MIPHRISRHASDRRAGRAVRLAGAAGRPSARVRVSARVRAAVTEVGTTLSIPVENLLTPELLRRVAWTPPDPIDAQTIGAALEESGARPWQIDATAQVIAKAFVEAAQSPEEPQDSPS